MRSSIFQCQTVFMLACMSDTSNSDAPPVNHNFLIRPSVIRRADNSGGILSAATGSQGVIINIYCFEKKKKRTFCSIRGKIQ